MNNKAIKNSILIITLGIFLANASVALAYVPGVWDPQPQSQSYSQSWTTPLALGPNTEPVISTSPIQSVFFGNSSTNKTVATNTSTTKNTTVKTTSTTNNTIKNTSSSNNINNSANDNFSNLPPVSASENNLGASAYHSYNFLPTTFFQWIFTILLILAIVIIARLIVRSTQTRTTHTVGAH